ncbi:probable E3 ubiquitin-protein ligase HECTD4 [Mytilus trossulus]|uniref:probable E3 ubiquitin-protein ligase HECTD4 n=1 Tax=Mytilus trossulus TaxID=6551 RepID=UPI003004F4EC
MTSAFQDCFQWMSVTEETLFLHDGLIRVTDLVELPRDVNNTQGGDNEVITFDLKSPKELSDRLLAVCGTQNNAYARLLEYRLNALRGYWCAQRQFVGAEQQDSDSSSSEETLNILKKQGLLKEPEQASFSTRISVLLVLPLLQSQSRIDPKLCGVTAQLLLDCLRDCPPISLAKEPGDCLRGLENLLCSWLLEEKDKDALVLVTDVQQRTSTAAALVALASARGHLKTFIHTIHLLQSLSDLQSLPVSDILVKLLETEGGQGPPPGLSGNKHVLCWALEDMLAGPEKEPKEKEKDKNKDSDAGRSVACDGKFLYTTNTQGKGVAKIGTGLRGTLRGYVYSRNFDVNVGRLAYGSGSLLCRPQSFDTEIDINSLCQVLHPNTLQVIKTIPKPEDYSKENPQTTVGFCSDGTYFYWIWFAGAASDKSSKGVPVYLEKFTFDSEQLVAVPQQSRITLQKKDESTAKALSESLLAKLRPFRGSSSSITLAALTGLDPITSRKDDGVLAGSTSCGISLKNLVKTPVTCDGSHVLFLTSISGGATTSSASRGLFGGGPGLTGLRTLGSCMCFHVKDGLYATKTDLSDAPTCSLGRGAAISAVGLCFDVMNNSIWMCSNDWVDQFYNPAHQAQHHIHRRLRILQNPSKEVSLEQNREAVIKDLLQHVGSMCLHQINNDLLHTPLGSYILQQHSADLVHVGRIVDILQRSLEVKDNQIILCSLIVLQLVFRVSIFKRKSKEEEDVLQRLSDLVWNLLKSRDKLDKPTDKEDFTSAVITEACHVLTNGVNVLYPTESAKNRLMLSLLDSSYEAHIELRDMILVDFADRLRGMTYSNTESKNLCFNDETVNLILKIAVKESCELLKESVSIGKNQFEELQARVPVASSCLRYMMSLQSFLLREAILYKSKTESEDSTKQDNTILKELQISIMNLASKVFRGSYQVLEALLDTCSTVISKHKEDLEYWLQGLERLAKATVLGHLLPVLLTAMTHPNLRCLQFGDNLMSQLVHLVVLTSQAALLLKSQVQAVQQEIFEKDSDIDVAKLIGQAVNLENCDLKEKEEEGFLAGLKIPAPWSSGKAIESIHPVRDNYKLKESVHIPGARCLYLRFDPRCASQYDYDKLVLYAGPTTNSKKVAEYGGNTYGFGSRSVLGSGWPKDLVKVEGDTVTFSFEMRSGREHNTPDKAMWGFMCTVRAQESTEEVSIGLPFLADLALGLSVLACTMLQLLYEGPDKSKQEISCTHLLRSKLLQRCVWQSDTGKPIPGFSPDSSHDLTIIEDTSLPRIKLPSDIIQNLRKLCHRPTQTLRPSIREVIQPDILEERVISTVIKHLSLTEIVHQLPSAENQNPEEFSLLQSVLQEVYKRLDALIRQLQSLAGQEQHWHTDVLDHKQENTEDTPPFFHDYHLQESQYKELMMLCFVKNIQPDNGDDEKSVKALREKFDADVQSSEFAETCPMTFTSHIVKGLLSRLDLLLQVNIEPQGGVSYSRNYSMLDPTQTGVMVRSDTDIVLQSYSLSRSMSAPNGVDISREDIKHKRQQKYKKGPVHILQDLVEEEEKDRPPYVTVIEQLFSFIGSDPQNTISSKDFLSAAQTRWRRGHTRKQALVHMKELLTAAARVGGTTHLVAAVTSVLQRGPCVDELTCGGMVDHVREAFSETMTSLVQLAARYPIACCNSIGLMCIIPYTRAEEKCLVRSGLVHLLDKLCSLANYRLDNKETQSTHQKVSAMAWAGFQVLANRCVMWETEDGSHFEQLEHSGLARQVSVLLTNHLARATESGGNEAAGSEALQDVLSLLNNLSRSKMGKAILSQPACVSKLLSLLLDQRPSPKLVLIILQLCRVALPLMSTDDCDYLELPSWGQHMHSSHWSTAESISDPPAKIVSLLLAKLGDFLVPGDYSTVCSRRPSTDPSSSHGNISGERDKNEDCDIQGGRLTVFVHKRSDQLSQEITQAILSSDTRQSRLGSLLTEKAVRMDRELNKSGKADVCTEDAVTALKKAAKWAQSGLVISTGSPVDSTPPEATNGDKKKQNAVTVCREKNNELARTDPVRPFISGHVANSMAGEVIALLHCLLTAPESNTAHSWANAVQRVLNNALSCLPLLLTSIDSLSSPRCSSRQLLFMAKLGNAALCSLGGFKEIIKPGCDVRVTGPGIHNTEGTVLCVSEQTGQVTVQLTSDLESPPRYSDTIQVPVTRLEPVRNKIYKSHHLPSTEAVVMAIKSILLPQDDNLSTLQKTFPVTGDGNTINNVTCRVIGELQTRACMVLASYLNDLSFSKEFIQHCGSTIDVLKLLAKECNTGDRLAVIEDHCTRLRLLYRDCAKPPPPPSKVDNRMNKEMLWDPNRIFPPVRTCVFSHSMTGVTFLGDPNTGSGLPRGTIVYANQSLPQQAPSFYWELEILSFGDSQDESGAVISFGFAPSAEKKEGAWTNPIGTCLFLNNGKSVHYNGASLLQWRSVRLDVTLNAGDIAGIGWERTDESPVQGQTPKGRVYFTYRGRLLSSNMEDVSGGMFPVVHVQKKGTRLRANFGTRPFAYAKGQQHRDAADEANDLTREIRESFGHLPFHHASESEDEEPTVASPEVAQKEDLKSPQGPSCKVPEIPKPQKEYDTDSCKQYKLFSSYDNFLSTGPNYLSTATQEDESDEEPVEDDAQTEDHYALLVKAWEQKVFPVIRRRFRNEAERKDGLEQIKGALQLGMTDIARQTVEFLYEENGGIPRDLHLPTTEDIKEDLAKFTIERVRKGTVVVVRNTAETSTAGTTMLPMFAVRSMLRTFGLTGTVLDVDNSNELVQVETYLRSEGVLIRFWYPIDMLERPGQGLRKSSITGGQILDTSNIYIHRELLRCEGILSRMYCRTALLKLIDHCNSPAMEIYSCSASLGSGMAASAALLQQLDIENLQLLSEELLCPPQPHGTVQNASLITSSSLEHCLAISSCSLTKLLYSDEDKLKRELSVAIARAANQGEDYLIELTNQICICLQIAPEMFPYEEFPVTEVKVNTDVHFPGASCLVVSCKTDPKVAKKDTSLYKSPWAKVLSYTGNHVRKTGQPTKLDCVSYPRDTSSTSNQNEQYTPAIIPCDRVHVKLGVSPPPGVMLTIHALYPQFLLAVAYIETLIEEKYGCGTQSCGMRGHAGTPSSLISKDNHQSLWNVDNIKITPGVFKHMIELLCRYLWKCSIPSLIKEYMFHLLAQSLRILNYSEGCNGSVLLALQPHLNLNTGLLVQLQMELRKLYEEETKGWESMSTASGVGMGIGVCDKGRFSTYFHSLLEVVLATAETRYDERSKTFIGLLMSAGAFGSSASGSSHTLGSPTSSAKKKKVKAKRDKERGGAVPKRTPVSSPRVSESDVSHSASASTSATSTSSFSSLPTSENSSSSSSLPTAESSKTSLTGTKSEDLLWFQRTLTVSQIIRHLAFREKQSESFLHTAILDAAHVLQVPSAYNRVLVITGIPDKISKDNVHSAVQKACQSNGGIDRNDIFIPVQTVSPKVRAVEKTETQGQVESENVSEQTTEAAGVVKATEEVPAPKRMEAVIKGTAVININSKSKVENIKKSLVKSFSFGHDELVDVPEEMMTISTVNAMLVTAEPQANGTLEEYLQYKFFNGSNLEEITEPGTLALIEIFHSCFIMDQRHCSDDFRQDSGFICLSKDLILQHVQENMLFCFFNNIKPPKKSLQEQVTQVLRKYGMLKSPDKEGSPGDRNGKGKGPRRSPKSSKEKVVMGVTEKPPHRDKKLKGKDMPEKTHKEGAEQGAKAGKSWPVEESRHLTLEGFLQYVIDLAKQDIRSVWRALLACGFDLFFERCACLDNNQALQMTTQWTLEMDSALGQYVNMSAKKLGVAPSRLHPHEMNIPEEILTNETYACLQGVPVESVRLRFAFLQSLNNTLETIFLPMVDLRPAKTYNRSTASALSKIRGLIFYDSKVNFVNRIMNATAKRKPDQAAPEVTLDPLENLSGDEKASLVTWYCQTFRQLSNIPSKQLCVRLASGGDPTYSFNVRLTGEEVHGTSGSFRQFLSQIAKELHTLKLIVPCNNSNYKSRCLLHPEKMTFPEERLTQFFGQILGITIRADIPLGLDLLKSLWEAIVSDDEDPSTNLQEADPLTYSFMKKIEMVESESELQALCSDVYPQFVYSTLSGEEVELIPNGHKVSVCWENRQEYVEAIQRLRMTELLPEHRVQSLHCGLASLIPLQLLNILSPLDLEIRTCGLPEVDLAFLKAHTMYQVGLMESDKHIEFFWNTLESLSQEDLCKFIKFSCNQERIPQTCPCKEGGAETTHVPPYPLKIAPPDGPGPPDSRFIRVETCMFMIKLPQYSTQELMTQRLLYAINCREDPLSR